jgi:ribosomal protein L40E
MDPEAADQVQPSEPVGADTPGRVSITNLPLIIGGFGLALIGIALFAYYRSTQSNDTKPRRRRRANSAEGTEQAYCHECGARANPGDRFCRTCGSRLRAE